MMKKGLLITLACLLLTIPTQVMASTNTEEVEVDWKTAISTNVSERILDKMFVEDDFEEKEVYVTTRLNMRTLPNVESEVKEVLKVNAKVKVVAEYNDWSRIVVENDNDVVEEYYVWNKYLSDKKVEIKSKTSNTSYTSYDGSGGEYLGNFKLTAYCNCSSCCGKWAGGATASGVMPTQGRTVAMGGISFGTKLLINGNVYTVEDRGTPYGHVDIYFNSHSDACNFGLQYADVYRVG